METAYRSSWTRDCIVPKWASDSTRTSLLPSSNPAVKRSAGRWRRARGAAGQPVPQTGLRQGARLQAPSLKLLVPTRVVIAGL